ncbi:hypothetical protein Q5H92_24350 [Hymenobacter sp. M29]|uniref:Uncharacterized protein n=1 Tax=Hymenobacter mellowenesis TaxID=3063995 RepID=A0ABT9AI64_9BACT|nr:hypothetical protein [Hymenobacter sp. M29]MDO7849519.1 hypothetical protein [Hymenobacter sp. M29]
MDWQATGNIISGLGVISLAIGLLLRFKIGRWLLAGLWLILTLGSLLGGDLHALADGNPDIDANPHKASNYWLIGGGICLLLGFAARAVASRSI